MLFKLLYLLWIGENNYIDNNCGYVCKIMIKLYIIKLKILSKMYNRIIILTRYKIRYLGLPLKESFIPI